MTVYTVFYINEIGMIQSTFVECADGCAEQAFVESGVYHSTIHRIVEGMQFFLDLPDRVLTID